MKTHGQEKFFGLDHLRAFAITIVFLFHYFILSAGQPDWLPAVAGFGWTGVDLFFVLSGFLIAAQLFSQLKTGQPISFTVFFLKRFFRILPAFWVVLGLYYCVPFFREKEALPPLWTFLTFTQNFGLNLKDNGAFSHAWSLCVEEHFYLFLPITLLLIQYFKILPKSYWLLIGLFIFGFILRTYSFTYVYSPKIGAENDWMYWYKYIYYPSYNRLDGLLVGVSIAGMYTFWPALWARLADFGNLFIGLSVCVLVGAYFLCDDAQSFAASIYGFPLIAFGYGLMVMGAISPTSFLFRWKSNITTSIASLSYAIYLTHKGIIHMTHQALADFTIDSNIMLLISIVTSVCGGVLLHLLIEKPFMRLRKHLTYQKLVSYDRVLP